MKQAIYLLFFFFLGLRLFGFNPVKRALAELDDLKIILSEKSGDLTTELEKWRQDLPRDVRSLIEDDIQKLSRDIIGATGSETRCTLDFLRNRFIQGVENIKAKLL